MLSACPLHSLLKISLSRMSSQRNQLPAPTDSSSQDSALPSAPAHAGQAHCRPNPRRSSLLDQQGKQTSRILGIIPNFRAVSTDQHLPPQSVKEKFVTATQDSFDYSSIAIPVAVAGYNYLRNSTPEFGTGGAGYGRYLWHVAVDQTSENYMVEFFVPAVTHEDTRFYTLGRGGFFTRAGYALSRVVVTRSDAGNPTFNLAEIVGAGISAGISSTYYPTRERSLAPNTGSSVGAQRRYRHALAFVASWNSGRTLISASSTPTNPALLLHHHRRLHSNPAPAAPTETPREKHTTRAGRPHSSAAIPGP